jgi:hypothetical protein
MQMKLLMENWRRFLVENETQDIVSQLDDIFASHPSGRAYHPAFEESPVLEEDDEESLDVSAIKQDITEEYLREFLETYKQHGHVKRRDFDSMYPGQVDIDKIDPKSLDFLIYRSIVLFTGGSVATVRDPSNYDPEKAKTPINYYANKSGSSRQIRFFPTKTLYEISNHVMTMFSQMANQESGDIYRGIALPSDEARKLIVGIEFNNRAISSWSRRLSVASAFAFTAANDLGPGEKDKDMKKILFNIQNPEYGTYIGNFSTFPSEQEYVLGKKVRISEIDKNVIIQGERFDLAITCSIVP